MKQILEYVAGVDAFDGIPTAKAQEWTSVAYMQAALAQAGLNIIRCDWDDGVDLIVGATKSLAIGVPRNLFIGFQIKSTSAWEVADNHIPYDLDQHNYDQLRSPSAIPQRLILYTMPRDRQQWLTNANDSAVLSNCAYWFDPSTLPASPNSTTTRIKVPVTQRVSSRWLMHTFQNLVAERGYCDGP